MKRALVIGFAVAVALAGPRDAGASCSFVSVTAPVFGEYNPLSIFLANDVMGSFVYKCGIGDVITITIDGGGSGNILARAMTRMGGGTTPLSYQLYSDATRLFVWGNTLLTQVGPIVIGSTSNKTLNLYGRIPVLQDVQPGSYGDSVAITINF